MFDRTINPDWLTAEDPHSLLERTVVAEYLFIRGYLIEELINYPHQVVNSLMRKACHFAEIKLAEIEHKDIFQQKFRLPLHLN